MNYILIFEKYKEIRDKYYDNISSDIIDRIVSFDPTTIIKNSDIKKMGIYSKWMINLYKNNLLKLEDLYKVKEYLEMFDRLKKKNELKEKDIFKYKSIKELYEVVKDKKEKVIINTKKEVYERTLVKEFDNIKVYVPNTKEEAIALGRNTEWCTSYDGKHNAFDGYNKLGKLFIIIDDDFESKLQFHSFSDQYMDNEDVEIDIHSYLDYRIEFKKWFSKYMSIKLLNHYSLPIKNSYDIQVLHKLLGGSDNFFKIILNDIRVINALKEIITPDILSSDETLLRGIDKHFVKDLENGGKRNVFLEGFLYDISQLECFDIPIIQKYLDYCIDKYYDDDELYNDINNMKKGNLDLDKYTGMSPNSTYASKLYKSLSEFYLKNKKEMYKFLEVYSICSDLFYIQGQEYEHTGYEDNDAISHILRNYKLY